MPSANAFTTQQPQTIIQSPQITIPIVNSFDDDAIMRSISGNFTDITQILDEPIDNSLSDYRQHHGIGNTVAVSISESGAAPDLYDIRIEDAAGGIEDLNSAFTLAGCSTSKTQLNEHGFGLKHALASADAGRNEWTIHTRTPQDAADNMQKVICAPFRIGNGAMQAQRIPGWNGKLGNTGTIIEFCVSRSMLFTATNGVRLAKPSLAAAISAIREDLGFTYADVIASGELQIILPSADGTSLTAVKPVQPEWETSTEISTTLDLSGGPVQVKCRYGRIKSSANIKHYKGNMFSSGAEISINSRKIVHSLYKEIWAKEKHPDQNHFLMSVDLSSDDPNALPATKTAKNGFREGDPRLDELFQWIRSMVPEPEKDGKRCSTERQLFRQLAAAKRTHLREPKTVSLKFTVFKAIGEKVRLDMYISENGDISIYEGKKGKTQPLDVSQLEHYWDGCVMDGIFPNKAILLGREHPEPVKELVKVINSKQATDGRNYNIVLKTWQDENIKY